MQEIYRRTEQILKMHGKSKVDKSETICSQIISRARPLHNFGDINLVIFGGIFQFFLATVSNI